MFTTCSWPLSKPPPRLQPYCPLPILSWSLTFSPSLLSFVLLQLLSVVFSSLLLLLFLLFSSFAHRFLVSWYHFSHHHYSTNPKTCLLPSLSSLSFWNPSYPEPSSCCQSCACLFWPLPATTGRRQFNKDVCLVALEYPFDFQECFFPRSTQDPARKDITPKPPELCKVGTWNYLEFVPKESGPSPDHDIAPRSPNTSTIFTSKESSSSDHLKAIFYIVLEFQGCLIQGLQWTGGPEIPALEVVSDEAVELLEPGLDELSPLEELAFLFFPAFLPFSRFEPFRFVDRPRSFSSSPPSAALKSSEQTWSVCLVALPRRPSPIQDTVEFPWEDKAGNWGSQMGIAFKGRAYTRFH